MSQRKPTAHGRELRAAICGALGIDPNKVTHLSLIAEPSDAAVVEIVRYLDIDEVGEIAEELTKYELHPREEPDQ